MKRKHICDLKMKPCTQKVKKWNEIIKYGMTQMWASHTTVWFQPLELIWRTSQWLIGHETKLWVWATPQFWVWFHLFDLCWLWKNTTSHLGQTRNVHICLTSRLPMVSSEDPHDVEPDRPGGTERSSGGKVLSAPGCGIWPQTAEWKNKPCSRASMLRGF